MPALRTTRASARPIVSNHPLSTSRTTREQKDASRNSRGSRKLTFVPQEKVAAIVAAVRVSNGALSRNQLKQLSESHGITQKAITTFANGTAVADGPFMEFTPRKDRKPRISPSISRDEVTHGTLLTTMKPSGGQEKAASFANAALSHPWSSTVEQLNNHSEGAKESMQIDKGVVKQAKRGAVKATIGLWYKQNGCSPDHVAVGDLIREQRITQQVYDGYLRRYGDIWRSEYNLEQSITEIAREGRGRRGRIIPLNTQEAPREQLPSSQESVLGPTRGSKSRHKGSKPYQRPSEAQKLLKIDKRSASRSIEPVRSATDILFGRTGDVARAKKAHQPSHILDVPLGFGKGDYMNDEKAQTQDTEWKKKLDVINYKETVVLGLIANTLSANEIQYWPELKF